MIQAIFICVPLRHSPEVSGSIRLRLLQIDRNSMSEVKYFELHLLENSTTLLGSRKKAVEQIYFMTSRLLREQKM